MKRTIVLAVSSLLLVATAVPQALGRGAELPIYEPDDLVAGVSQSEWMGRYEVWFNEIPTDRNPAVDPLSPENCALQPGGVVFLGPFGSDCTVPVQTPLVLGTAGWECSTAEGLGETYEELTRCAKRNFRLDFGRESGFRLRLAIDGERIRGIRRWVFLTAGEIIDFPKDNIWGAIPGPSKSVSKGFQQILKPLDVGSHVIRMVARFPDGPPFVVMWKLEVAYGG